MHLKNTKARHPQSRAVHAHAGHVKGQPLKVQLPPCLASPEDSPVASTSQPMSVIEAFTGATVLVTGGTGYLGSLVRKGAPFAFSMQYLLFGYRFQTP